MTGRSCLLAGWLSCLAANVGVLPASAQDAPRGEPRRINIEKSEPAANADRPASNPNQKLAEEVAAALSSNARLNGYRIDVVVVGDIAELHGRVQDAGQREIACQTARSVPGIVNVRDQLSPASGGIAVASQDVVPNLPDNPGGPSLLPPGGGPFPPMPNQVAPRPGAPMPIPSGAGAPGMTMPYHPGMANGAYAPEPAPVYQNQPGMMPNPQYQPPPLPPYAWPTYAPHNNYSRVAHPLLYSHNQWPFIGPMYPYPKVPLGWRKVSLEWQDGSWWYGRESTSHDWWRVRYW